MFSVSHEFCSVKFQPNFKGIFLPLLEHQFKICVSHRNTKKIFNANL